MKQDDIESACDLLAYNLENIEESDDELADTIINTLDETFGQTINPCDCLLYMVKQPRMKGSGLLFNKPACDIEGELDWLKPLILDNVREWLEQEYSKQTYPC